MLKQLSRIVLFLLSSVVAFPQTKSVPVTPAQSRPVAPKDAPKTLGSFKRQFLNQDVIVNDVPFEESYCLQWTTARQVPDGTYQKTDEIMNHLAIGYRGQTGTVVAIQLAKSILQHTNVGGTNAFGESVSEDEIDNPYMEVVVKFKDGMLGMTAGYIVTLPELMELASKRQSLREDMASKLPSMIGRKLYAVGFSRLYKPTATIEDLSGIDNTLTKLSISDVPLLEPLTITKVKYLPDVDAVLMKLSLPNGTEAIAYTPSLLFHFEELDEEFLAHVAGTLYVSVPQGLTAREIEAIKGMKLFRGMSKDALDYAIGFCEKENDWGRGGKQRIYFNGKLIVYLDNSDKIEDWQNLD
jgi:hypothetical protein